MANETNQNAAPAAPAPSEAPVESSEGQELESQEQSTEGEGEEAPAAVKPEPKKSEPRTKKFKLKVDGKEYEEEVNLDDDEYLTRNLQLAKVAQKRMGEHSELNKRVETFLKQLRENPRAVLSDPNIGVDLKKLAASVIEEEIENSKKSPEQLEKEKLEKELKTAKEALEKEKEEMRQREFQRLQEQAYERYDILIGQAIEKTDLPKTPYLIKKVADYLLLATEAGIDATPDDVMPLVRDEMLTDVKEMFSVMPEDVIEGIIGKDVVKKLRAKSLAKAKAAQQAPSSLKSVKDVGKTTKEEETSVKKKTIREMFGA
jgi:hypothetical protein